MFRVDGRGTAPELRLTAFPVLASSNEPRGKGVAEAQFAPRAGPGRSLVSLSTLALNHFESWLYGMMELREAAMCGAASTHQTTSVGARYLRRAYSPLGLKPLLSCDTTGSPDGDVEEAPMFTPEAALPDIVLSVLGGDESLDTGLRTGVVAVGE